MARLLLVGPPGAGKGTQARLLEQRLGTPHISSGDLLREAVRRGTEKGHRAQEFMNRGELVPDPLVVSLIEERLGENNGSGFLLDGFPRNLSQVETLTQTLARIHKDLDLVVSITVPDDELVRRLSGRRTCRACGAMYHVVFGPPATPGHCNQCGGEVYQREDDREETIRARLAVFARETEPVLEHYRMQGLLREVDGSGAPEEVLGRILAQVTPGS